MFSVHGDSSNYRSQKVYKNHGFAKSILILACDATNKADDAMVYTSKEDSTTSNKYTN